MVHKYVSLADVVDKYDNRKPWQWYNYAREDSSVSSVEVTYLLS